MESVDIHEEEFKKEAYRPRLIRRKRKAPSSKNVRQKIKNRMMYRKNKWKLKVYNRKYRQKNKMQLKRRRVVRIKKTKPKIFKRL